MPGAASAGVATAAGVMTAAQSARAARRSTMRGVLIGGKGIRSGVRDGAPTLNRPMAPAG